ncbi:MAG TPA: NADPH-dependent FMN reductase [Kofleriaceae bacterium]|jgi:FMN reductase|nr:NADPH-dependent FMN reductase [Kofleriaceae bacterium]
MASVVTITGSPSHPSRTAALALHVADQLRARGFELASINVRDLPARELLTAQVADPGIAAAIHHVERADAVVVATPIYKAAYSGALKVFLDLLPQFALAGKVVLPLATGGTLAHVLALDYGLRPVLVALGAQHIVNGLFILDKMLTLTESGLALDADIAPRLGAILDDFVASIERRAIAAITRTPA